MTVFDHTTGFTRGEVEASVYDRFDVEFFRSASKRVDNWFPDVTGALERRPPFAAMGKDEPVILQRRPSVVPPEVECGRFFLRTFLFRRDTYLILFRKVCDDGWRSITLSVFRVTQDRDVIPQFEDFFVVHYSNEAGDLITALNEAGEDIPPDSFDGNSPEDFQRNLGEALCFAQVGPAVFITSPLFPPYRIFIDDNGDAQAELVAWFEELVGEVEVELNKNKWEGTDTLFEDQLSVGEKFYFRGDEYEVQSITNQEEMRSTTNFDTLNVSVAGERISKKSTVFDDDWPRLCTFYKGRLLIFSTRTKPVGMFASRPSDPFVIRPGSVFDDAPIELELLTEGAESFQWVSSGEKILLGGGQSEYIVDTLSDVPLTPTSFSFYKVANNGGASLQPFTSNASTVFTNRGRTRVQSVQFSDQRAGFVAQDISLLAPHLLENRIQDLVFRPGTQNDRAPRIFVLTDEFELRSCTFAEQENVVAWNRISFAEGIEPRAIATSPDDFFLIMRTPDDSFVLSILDVDNTEFYLMDLTLTYTATAGVVTLSEIHHNTTVAVLDGSRFVGFFDTTTELDIGDEEFSGELIVGITYASRLEMLPPIAPQENRGASLNRVIRLLRVLVGIEEAYEMAVNEEPLFGTVAENEITGFPKREGTFERRFFGFTESPNTSISVTSLYRAKLRSVTRELQVSG